MNKSFVNCLEFYFSFFMYPVYFTVGLILIIALIGFISEQMKKSKAKTKSSQENLTSIADNNASVNFVNRLKHLGYFRYTNPKDLDLLRQTMIDEFDPAKELVSVWEHDISAIPKDYRYYFCDNEDLFEEGGFAEMLKTLQPTFSKIGLILNINNHYEVWDNSNSWLNHSITVNGTKYIIFKNFTEAGWAEAAQRLAEILNAELEKQHNDERVYLVNGGNDGRLIFLTSEQFTYIDSVYTNKYWKPLKVNDWCVTFEVAPMPE
jgi:hypothetical protein